MKPILLPAIHGKMGDRSYYSVVVSLAEVARRVNYAEEIHESKELADFIQRRLHRKRANQIADYLRNNEERFFNSLVIAVYGGDPLWYDAGEIEFSDEVEPKPVLPEDISDRIGFLYLTGEEKLFALDGQHRLAGIRKAVSTPQVAQDLVSAIFVGHEDSDAGKVRTRRLFTVLNKHAKPVKPADIIALDEDDAPAIITRSLVKSGGLFDGQTVSFTASNSLNYDDRSSLITILALYECVQLFVEKMPHRDIEQISSAKKSFERPSQEVLDRTTLHVTKTLQAMIDEYEGLHKYFSGSSSHRRVGHNRTRRGGSVVFRPVGFNIFARLVIDLVVNGSSMLQAVRRTAKLPMSLSDEPYRRVLWQPDSQRMNARQKGVVLDLLRIAVEIPVKESRLKTIARSLNDSFGLTPGSEEYMSADDVAELGKSIGEQ